MRYSAPIVRALDDTPRRNRELACLCIAVAAMLSACIPVDRLELPDFSACDEHSNECMEAKSMLLVVMPKDEALREETVVVARTFADSPGDLADFVLPLSVESRREHWIFVLAYPCGIAASFGIADGRVRIDGEAGRPLPAPAWVQTSTQSSGHVSAWSAREPRLPTALASLRLAFEPSCWMMPSAAVPTKNVEDLHVPVLVPLDDRSVLVGGVGDTIHVATLEDGAASISIIPFPQSLDVFAGHRDRHGDVWLAGTLGDVLRKRVMDTSFEQVAEPRFEPPHHIRFGAMDGGLDARGEVELLIVPESQPASERTFLWYSFGTFLDPIQTSTNTAASDFDAAWTRSGEAVVIASVGGGMRSEIYLVRPSTIPTAVRVPNPRGDPYLVRPRRVSAIDTHPAHGIVIASATHVYACGPGDPFDACDDGAWREISSVPNVAAIANARTRDSTLVFANIEGKIDTYRGKPCNHTRKLPALPRRAVALSKDRFAIASREFGELHVTFLTPILDENDVAHCPDTSR